MQNGVDLLWQEALHKSHDRLGSAAVFQQRAASESTSLPETQNNLKRDCKAMQNNHKDMLNDQKDTKTIQMQMTKNDVKQYEGCWAFCLGMAYFKWQSSNRKQSWQEEVNPTKGNEKLH